MPYSYARRVLAIENLQSHRSCLGVVKHLSSALVELVLEGADMHK
jgi:hypothetical protein